VLLGEETKGIQDEIDEDEEGEMSAATASAKIPIHSS
jgi:hypothetical protein